MIVMENSQNRKTQMNDQLDSRDAQETLPMLGYGLINISNLSNNDKIHVLFQKGIGTPLIQNVVELCKKEIKDQKQGNSIIPLDDFSIFIHYFQHNNNTIVILYMTEKDHTINFPKLYFFTRKITNQIRLNTPISEVINTCNKTISIPQTKGIIGVFIIGANGCPYISKINKNRKLISNKEVHIGGFISALFSFSKEIIGQESGAELKEINFGNQRFYMITKKNVIFAFLVENLNSLIERYMYLIADDFLEQYKEHLIDFTGDIAPFHKFKKKIDLYFEI
jgi:hypothetical protein